MIEDTGADGLELNFGCPHGMSERGMGSAVGQVPEYIQQAAAWCKKFARVPVIVKLTPNITNILPAAKAAKDGGADAVSLINTLNSIMRVDYDSLTIYPATDGKGSHGGYCGPAVKPIALHMVAEIARSRDTARPADLRHRRHHRLARRRRLPRARRHAPCRCARPRWSMASRSSTTWSTASATISTRRASRRWRDLVGKAVPSVTDWQYLNLNHVDKAFIDQDLCIKCGRCHIVCEDTSHQAITATVERRAALRGDRRRVRRLQSVRQCLPGGKLHHHAADDERRRPAHRPRDHAREGRLDHAPEQPGPQTDLIQSACKKNNPGKINGPTI